MKKQTAVEWLEIQLKKGIDFNPLEPLSYPKAVDKLFEQAKAIEKQQIEKAYNESWRLRDKPYLTALQYYTSTYGS
jgi:hypothetical protein